MKVRNGFVSNSSSSSFVISGTEKPVLELVVHYEVIENEQQLEMHIMDNYGDKWREYNYALEEYNELLQEIRAGNCIYFTSVDNSVFYDHDVKINGGKVIRRTE